MTLTLQEKLATVDKLTKKGMIIVNRCVLFKAALESHNHLFFKCPYSATLWQNIMIWMKVLGRTNSLKQEIAWISSRHARRHWKTSWYLGCMHTLVYSLWEERNSRIFQGSEHDVEYMLRRVQYIVCVLLFHVSHKSEENEFLEYLNA
ncbi:uncharacterized protein LOC141640835 [Silene latifolia]|uniref:uncharacterized protein LOC141640835 n=1 Tax=Silene latifolia TaxID=37657 RepID=UPI003D788250